MASWPRAPLLLALLLLAPVGAAQTDATSMRVTVEPFGAPIPPLKGMLTTKVMIDAPCLAPGSDPTRARMDLWVTDVPAWSTVTIAPSSVAHDPTACKGGRLAQEATLAATTTDQAPAFAPQPFRVHAAWVGAMPNLTASDDVEVSASYFSILDVQLAQSIQTVRPGGVATFVVKLANLGNDVTKVVFELEAAENGFTTAEPKPIVLQSKQAGGDAISAEVPILVQAPEGAGYTNQVGTVTYRIRSHHATQEDLVGDATTISLLVTAKGFDAPAPGPGVLPLLALAAVAALVSARRLRAS